MNSIRKKLFIQMGGLILFFIISLLLVNSTLLESYYIDIQKDILTNYYNTINKMEAGKYMNYRDEFVRMETTHNIDITIADSQNYIIYATNRRALERRNPKPSPPQQGLPIMPSRVVRRMEEISDDVQLLWTNDSVFDHQILMLTGLLDSGDIVELVIPFASIENSIGLFNNFLLIVGFITIIISLISIYFISGHFTKPILEINRITNQMKNLRFDQKCTVKTNDEIGQLAEGINDLSMELYNRIERLKDIAEDRKHLLNSVSHELKTPLALMQGYAEGLKKGLATNKDRVDFYCEVIVDETKNMTLLVEELLNLDELDQGSSVLERSNFEINTNIAGVIEKFRDVIEDKGIDLKFNRTEETKVYADAFKTERVFTNYLTNAINYVDKRLQIEVSLKRKGDSVRILVFNTAEEIHDNDLNRIWDSFYKVDKARSREAGGHGLGLSIVKAIQESHNSDYGVDKVENGVIFWFDVSIPSS